MSAPTPMSDERLAEIEATLDGPGGDLSPNEQRVVLAEVRRLRVQERAYQRLSNNHLQLANEFRARVDELEAEVERLRERHDSRCISLTDSENNVLCDCRVRSAIDGGKAVAERLSVRMRELEAECDQLKLAREHPHSAKLAARIMRAEDRVAELEKENAELRTSELFCGVCAAGVESSEHHERCVQPLEQAAADRDRARSIAVALEQQAAPVRKLAENWSGGACLAGYRLPDEDDSDSECLHCAADVILRALDGEATDG